ncbi:MAG: peptidoglycan DD-metalloendopeptidase family protein [Candidatus Pacebacteria bacterium]|nr:peptidoglycan DD-metalloendopeptidase family protein [Candidatus Paceibacterota bacterium]
MITKPFIFIGSLLLLTLSISMPISVFASHRDYEGSDWRRGSSAAQDAVADLDNDPVEYFPIPVLFGVAVKNMTKNFGDVRPTRLHEGLDIMAPEGTPIVSPTDAVVVRTGNGSGSGNYVTTANPGDESFVYMHLSEIADIEEGDVLEVGDLIGYVGYTGSAVATAPHLHLEVRDEDGDATDPYPRLNKPFDLDDKIDYLEVILGDSDDEDELAELLVTKFRSEFTTAKAQDIELPDAIEDALKKIPAPVVGSSTGTLRVGSRGPLVVELQTYLIKKDIGSADRVVADGSFGPITRQALIDFQKSASLTADGIYGPKSKAYVVAHP